MNSEQRTGPAGDIFDAPPLTRWQLLRAHVGGPWSLARVGNFALAALSRTPGLRAHVLHTTAIKDHPLYPVLERSWQRAVADAAVAAHETHDHPAGCFYGTFGGYPDNWHIPFGADCDLDHGPDPIRLEAPGGAA